VEEAVRLDEILIGMLLTAMSGCTCQVDVHRAGPRIAQAASAHKHVSCTPKVRHGSARGQSDVSHGSRHVAVAAAVVIAAAVAAAAVAAAAAATTAVAAVVGAVADLEIGIAEQRIA